ncbi:MAG: DUF5658 family protein [Methanocalculus sp.]|uniref:DUF5658 family protein n=1 Tax=Methanocalculus sp. TaxID=2004547 RepID=UPI00272300C0|nr:DUF5658 family protein [Methanocalculus sp.]MDO9540216.1 DUF5658 family protein [Methanocalculus sp.]
MTSQPCTEAPWISRLTGKFILPDYRVLILALASLFLLDVITTELILILGGVELNPVMAGIVASPILHLALKAAVFLFVITTTGYAERRVPASGVVALAAVVLWYGVVIGNNLGVLAGMG